MSLLLDTAHLLQYLSQSYAEEEKTGAVKADCIYDIEKMAT